MGRCGQISMEYLLVTGFAFALLVPIVIIAFSQSSSFSHDVAAAQIQTVGQKLADAVDTVYYAGPPTKKTIKLNFPQGVQSVVLEDTTILFTVQGSTGTYEYAAFTSANVTGALQPFAGMHVITVEALEDVVNVTE